MNYEIKPIDEKALRSFFPDEDFVPKSQKTRIKILQGAVKTFAENGIEKATFTQIAKDAGVSRPLVVHYYKTLDEIFLKCSQYVLYSLFRELQNENPKAGTAKEKLQMYVTSYMRGVKKFPLEAKMFLRFQFQSALSAECRKQNTENFEKSVVQVHRLLDFGISTGEFHCVDSRKTAEFIINYLSGRILLLNSTNIYTAKDVEEDLIRFAVNAAVGSLLH